MSKKKYKIAICFSGQPRFITEGAYWNNRNWIQPIREFGHEVDIFCHSWDTNWAHIKTKEGLKKYQEDKEIVYVKENRDIITKELVKSYNPKLIKYDDFHKTAKSILDSTRSENGQHLSAILSNDLSKKYEEEHNFKYDLKIRFRYDAILYSNPKYLFRILVPELWEDEVIYVQAFWKWGAPSKNADWCIQDKFLITRGYIMDEVMNMDHLVELKKDGVGGQNTIWFYLVDKAQWRVKSDGDLRDHVIRQYVFDDNPDYKTWTEDQIEKSYIEWHKIYRPTIKIGGKDGQSEDD